MLYDEYANLSRAKQSRAAAARLEWQQHQHDQGRLLTGKKISGNLPGERPDIGIGQSSSTSRLNTSSQQPKNGHSPSASSSTASLSPSNSASQYGIRPKQQQDGGYGLDELLAAHLDSFHTGSGSEKRPEIVHAKLLWLPTYLRRRALLAFITSLCLVIIILEYILSLSGRLLGLGSVDGSRYAWQMAPPAVLLIIVGYWQRFEYQARSTAPWLRMYKGPTDAARTLLLDYVSMTRLSVVVRAFQNKDWIVVGAVAVSMLLWTAVIVSTGAITTVLVTMTDSNVNVRLTRQFAADGGALVQKGLVTSASKATSLLEVAALQLGELTMYPDGATNRFAYETFDTKDLAPGAQLTAPVRGLFPNLTCEKASISVNSVTLNDQEQVVNTTLIAPGCAVELTINGTGLASGRGTGSPTYFLRSGTGGCYGSKAPQDQRIVVAFGVANIRNGSEPDYERFVSSATAVPLSTQLICQPGYTMHLIDVVKSWSQTVRIELGTSPPSALPNLPGVHPWDLAAAMLRSYVQDVPEVAYLLNRVAETDASGYPGFQPARVMIDAYVHFALGLRMGESGSLETAEEFLDSDKLENIFVSYYRHHASLVAYSLILRSPTGENSTFTGTSVNRFERVGANPTGVHFVVILVAASAIVASVLFYLVPTEGFLPRSPNSLIDTAALLVHSNVLLHNVRGAGGADSKTLWNRLCMAYFYTGVEAYGRDFISKNEGYFKVIGGPLPPTTRAPEYFEPQGGSWAPPKGLSTLYRALSLSVILTLIVVLEVMFRTSSANNGLVAIGNDSWIQLLWMVLPAAVLVCLTFYVGLVDGAIRALAPFMELAWGRGTFRTMTVSYLDGSTPRVLYHAVVGRNLPVVLSTVSWTMAALLPVFVATTFDMRAVALQSPDPTQQNQWRLQQDEAATRALQVLLVLILVGSAVLWTLTPRRKIGVLPRLQSAAPLSIASVAAMLADGNIVGMLSRGAEWKTFEELELMFKDGLHVTTRFRLAWDEARGRTKRKQDAFGISAIRTGGWGGGESVGLGMQARVGYWQKPFVRDWGWKP